MSKRVMLVANSASMIDHFNRDNINILQGMGYEITVAANFKDGNSSTREKIADFEKELEVKGIDIVHLPIPRNVTQLFKMFKSVKMIKTYLKENPCALVHTQTPFGGVAGRLATKSFRKTGETKVIYFVHGFHFFKGASFKNYLIYYNIEKHLAKYTDCLITLNQEDYKTASKKFKKTQVEYVPGVGVDTTTINTITVDKKAKCKELKIPHNKKIILTMAELIPRKNVEGAINAFAACENDDAILLICGKGKEQRKLKDLVKELDLKDKVYFAGYRTDILEICRMSDIFLFTSRQEGLPVAVMQAMAAGLPVIASDIRGNRDLLAPDKDSKSKDYLVDVDDTEEFTKKLNYLLKKERECEKLGAVNVANCRKYFDIELVHDRMTEIYQELLSSEEY